MIYYSKRNNFTLGSGIIKYASTNYKPQGFLDKMIEEAAEILKVRVSQNLKRKVLKFVLKQTTSTRLNQSSN